MRSSEERVYWYTAYVLLFLVTLVLPSDLFAASDTNTTLAAPIKIEGAINDGDIVSYDPEREIYRASDTWSDSTVFGIVVDDPVLYMEDGGVEPGTRPVVRFGESYVNVTDLGGDIQAGDLITTSRIVGTGQRMSRDISGYIIGFALNSVSYATDLEPIPVDDKLVRIGKVPVALRIGFMQVDQDIPDEVARLLASTTEMINNVESEETSGGFDIFMLFRYFLGSFVAIAAVVLALRRFGDLFAQSVISVGRNPLARTQIHSILVWNAFLIVVVSGVGFGIGIAIIVM